MVARIRFVRSTEIVRISILISTLPVLLTMRGTVVMHLFAGHTRSWMSEAGVYICRCRAREAVLGRRLLGGKIRVVHAVGEWWDVGSGIWLESALFWCGAWRECFRLVLGNGVIPS